MKLTADSDERDRLRAEANSGNKVCPICGRQADEVRERQQRQQAEANSRLHAEVVRLEAEVVRLQRKDAP